jgi:hypothetical protein
MAFGFVEDLLGFGSSEVLFWGKETGKAGFFEVGQLWEAKPK